MPDVTSSPTVLRARFQPMQCHSYAVVQRRMHTLGMPDAVVRDCTTVGQVQCRARAYYWAQAKRLHPDRAPSSRWGYLLTGAAFRRLVTTYAWLMGLDPRARLQRPAVPVLMAEVDTPDPGAGWHVLYY